MDGKSLHAAILGGQGPRDVEKVKLRLAHGKVHVRVALPPGTLWVCPECQAQHRRPSRPRVAPSQHLSLSDTRPRARTPVRVSDPGTRQVRVPQTP